MFDRFTESQEPPYKRITERVPDRKTVRSIIKSKISKRLPPEEDRARYKLYAKLSAAVLSLVGGATLFLSGIVIIPMMAFAYNVLSVVGSAAMVTTGLALAGGAYLWLTSPV